MKFFVNSKNRFKFSGGMLLAVCVIFSLIFLLRPVPAYSQCTYNFDSGGACTFTQSPSVDNCPGSSAPSTNAINEFYAYGASGVSVLYCGGSTGGGQGSPGNPRTLTISMQCSPPTGATIQAAYLDVVYYDGSDANPSPCTTAVKLGGNTSPAGVMTGTGNLWNDWIDPRYGLQASDYPNQTAINVRYNVTALVSLNTNSYTLTAPNLCSNYAVWSGDLVIVYTVPAAGVCGAVALDDGIFYFDDGDGNVREGVTPFAPTVDWSCFDPTTSCGTNQFSVFGGSQYGFDDGLDTGVDTQTGTVPFKDNFYGTTSQNGATAPLANPPAAEWECAGVQCGQPLEFDGNYPGAQMSAPNKITWGLGYANIAYKQEYWVNMLAGGCNSTCITPTPTPTNTPTNTVVATATATTTNTPTQTVTNTTTNTV